MATWLIYEAGKGEHGLKLWAKAASKTAFKHSSSTFLQQTADRVFIH